eukprot:TRINITY_DN9130_c0_g1_i3.p1 TRINITY_DN9130_c0_g1~~TRINITY_DN9130_c0_g1_i3.p1  ORF type:complete len:175 (-),score=35.46 TRINITY_DN9130_c0_g1_i3:20-544(-)
MEEDVEAAKRKKNSISSERKKWKQLQNELSRAAEEWRQKESELIADKNRMAQNFTELECKHTHLQRVHAKQEHENQEMATTLQKCWIEKDRLDEDLTTAKEMIAHLVADNKSLTKKHQELERNHWNMTEENDVLPIQPSIWTPMQNDHLNQKLLLSARHMPFPNKDRPMEGVFG